MRSGRKGRRFKSGHPDSAIDAVEPVFYSRVMDDHFMTEAQRCARCGEVKSLDAFHRMGTGRQRYCKPCRRDWDAAYWVRRRLFRISQQKSRRRELREWISSIKSSSPCTDCGGYFHWAAMTYDHLPGHEKRGDISDLIAGGYRSVLITEMAKCEVVCANCHAIRTFRRRVEARARAAGETPSVSEAGAAYVIHAA